MSFSHIFKHFRDLTPLELYSLLRLRNEVFVVEQQCIFQDADNKDIYCFHILLYQDDQLVAYARLVPPGLSYPEMSIGRVVSASSVRGKGAGKAVMLLGVEYCRKIFGEGPIRIGAQVYAMPFYESVGFKSTNLFYDEDGIDHVEMLRQE